MKYDQEITVGSVVLQCISNTGPTNAPVEFNVRSIHDESCSVIIPARLVSGIWQIILTLNYRTAQHGIAWDEAETMESREALAEKAAEFFAEYDERRAAQQKELAELESLSKQQASE